MKLIFAAVVLMCSVIPVAFGQKVSKNSDAGFKTLTDRYFTAWGSLNPDNAAPLYAKDADLVFYDIAPLKYTGWAEYDKGVRNLLGGFETLKLTPNNDLKVTRRGSFAWTTVTFHLSAKPKVGGQMELDGRHTAIWEKRGREWVIVHEHFSAPLPG
jgi:ketosteroid isomerase-like protein